MKKFTLLAAVAGVALAASAVESTIVGYNTVTSPAAGKYIALAIQFENVGESARLPISSVISVADPKGSNALAGTADQIWLWDTANGGWNKYFYRVNRGTVIGWCKSGTTAVTTDTVGSGETFFFYRSSAGAATSLTISGAVKPFTAEPTYSVTPGKYTFMAYPWPVALPIADVASYCSNPKGSNAIAGTADQIWLWNSTKGDWDKYFYRVNRSTVIGWCKSGETVATSASIPAGEGFFFYHSSAGANGDTVTFTYE